jgi:hypothetical protein
MRLTFYNHYGVGDLVESREFVLDWMRLAGVTEAEYAHRSLPRFFEDLPQIRSIDITPEMDMRQSWDRVHRTMYVNTWIGRDGRYVVNPGVGCTVEGLYRMHNDMLADAGLGQLPRTMAEYIPTIDYSRVNLGHLHEWLDEHAGMRLVLFCNGKTGSGHAPNFDFGPMLDRIVERPDTRFIFTDASASVIHDRRDVVFSDELTGRWDRPPGAYGPCDFNAIGYLSRFCEIIVGRCSGAQMAANVLPNWMDSTKKLVCFTQHRNGACFVLNPDALGLKMKVVWSPADNAVDAGKVLEEVLKGR